MQQTETYKLNLIEPDDTFSPEALNENTRKLEAAIGSGGTTARFYMGSYTGQGTYGASHKNSITLPFEPKILFMDVLYDYSGRHIVWARGAARYYHPLGYGFLNITWDGNTVTWYQDYAGINAAYYQMNERGQVYYYIAIG